MALTINVNTDANNKVTSITPKENEFDKEYRDYIAKNPEPNPDNIRIESAPAPAPTTQPAPTTTPTTGSTTGATTSTTPSTTPENTTPSWIMDAHFSQQYFLDEAQKRKNPDYVSEIADVPDAAIENIALAIKSRKENHPNQWVYGDPGWNSEDPLWSEYIKPLEDAYQDQVRAQQIQAQQAQESIARDKLADNARFSKAIVDTSDADISTLSNSGKVISYGTPSYAGTDAKNQSGIAKYTQQLLGSWMSGGGTAKGASMLAGLMGFGNVQAVNLVVHGLTSGYQLARNTGNIKPIKALDTIIEYSDIADEKMQNALGALAYAFEKTGGGDLYDPSQAIKSTKHLVENAGDIIHYAYGSGKASTEYPKEVVGAVTGMSANIAGLPLIGDEISRGLRNALSAAFGDEEYITRYQTTRANSALPGVYDLDEEMVGSNGIMFWLDLGKFLYDNGMTDENEIKNEIQFMISQYYGDRATFSEYLEHEIVDPGNTIENMDSRVIQGYASAMGKLQGIDPEHNNLLRAAQANTGSIWGDLTGGIPILPDVAREIFGKAKGNPNFMSTSSGMNEVFAQWHRENITNPAEDLTSLDRRFSGISEDNKISRVMPNPNTSKNILERVGNAVRNFFSETNESRAAFEGEAIFAYIDQGIEDAISARGSEDTQTTVNRINQFVDELANPDKIDIENSPFAENYKSVLYNSIKDDLAEAVRAHRAEINEHINRYFAENLDTNRQTLYTLAKALNLTPQQLLDKYQNDKPRLTQMILNLADKNGGKIEGIDIEVESKEFGDAVMKRIAPFAGDEGEPWDLRMLGIQISTSIADGVTDTLINKFGIKPDKLIYRFGDTIKKMQNLLLLGLSPSYLANNLLNNMVTRTSLGYGGYMSPKTIGNWMKRFGYSPDRFMDSISNEIGQESKIGDSKYGKLIDGIREKKRVKGVLDKIGNFSSKASSTVGVFGNLSNKVESSESQQIVAAAMMNYMARTWKKGVNFRRMPLELEAAIEEQMPGMVDTIYSAISSGINMEEIEKALFGTFIAPSVEGTLRTAAQRLGVDEELINEYFVKNGMLDQLRQSLHGKQGAEIDNVIADFAERLKSLLSIEFDEEIARRAETIGNQVTEEGFATAINCAYDSADEWNDIWTNSILVNRRIFQRRIEEGIPTKEFRAMYQEHQRNLTERWENVYKKAQQTFEGILRGIGIKDKNNQKYLKALSDKNSLWLNFYKKTQPELIQPYLDSLVWIEGDTKESWDSRVTKAWNDYQTAIESAVNYVYEAEAKLQKDMDKAYLAGLKEAVGAERAGEIDSKFQPIFDKINAKRAEIIEQTKIVRKEANKTNELLKKNKAYLDAEQARLDLIDQYTNFQHELYDAIDDYRSIITNKVSDTNAQANHSEKIALEIQQAKARRQQRKAERDSEKATDAIAEGADAEEAHAYVKYSDEFLEKLPGWAQLILTDPNDDKTIIEKYNDIKENLPYAFQSDISNAHTQFILNAVESMGRDFEPYEADWVVAYIESTIHNKISKIDTGLPELSEEQYESYFEAMMANGGKDPEDLPDFLANWLIENGVPEAAILDLDDALNHSIDRYNDTVRNLELYTNLRDQYYVRRSNLADIAIRAGATPEVAQAFARYISLIADRWENNHIGENFFNDAPGMNGLLISFHNEEKLGDAGGRILGNYNDGGIINIFLGGDIHALIHELGHGFQWTLDEQQQRALAQYFGIELEEYQRLMNLYHTDYKAMTENDIAMFSDMTEVFARGFVDFLENNEAPNANIKHIFASFKKFITDVFGDVSHFILQHLNYPRYLYRTDETLGISSANGIIRANAEQNNMTLQQIFDSMTEENPENKNLTVEYFTEGDILHSGTDENDILGTDINEETNEGEDFETEEDPEASAMRFLHGQFQPVDEIDFEVFEIMERLESNGTYGDAVAAFAGELYDWLKDLVYPKDETNPGNMFAPPTVEELIQYIMQDTDEDGAKYISAERSKNIDFLVESVDDYGDLRDRINDLRTYRQTFATPPSEGTYVGRCYKFEYGEYNFENNNPIVGMVYHNGEVVAYVPLHMEQWEIPDSEDNTKTYKVLGVSPENPAQWVYKNGDEIITESLAEEPDTNSHSGEMDQGTMPTHDPTGDAHNKLAYESIFNLLQEFASLYKHDLTDNMSKFKFNDLSDDVKEFVRGYISRDIRQDLNNTKYKAGKFGEMMRDAALLNYNKRYGFDNFFTLLCPYQFWMSRSVINWLTRMNTKGGKMWRKYYKLKEIERRNKKEFMPSKVTGKFGLYIPGLPDWMGDAIFMSTDQLFVVNQFVEPILNRLKKKNSILAAAEKYLQEEFEEGNISYSQYLLATNEETKENDPNWQAALARAQLENDSDTGLGNLFQQYFGWNLPVSTMKALITGDQSGWNQWPITRTGTAFRAILDNTGLKDVGKGVQMVLSAPEKALRDAAVKTFGDSFAYNEFGAFGNYYITQQVFDMVVEGRIEASDAVQATIEKDGNPIWEEAADRQRQETLVKMQSGSVIDATKKLIKDWRAGNKAEDTIGDDIKYLFASIIIAPMSKAVVHESERTWRQDKADLNKAYEAKANGDKEAVNRYYDEHEYATYNNLRYEDNTETMLRQFLYKSIMDKYFDLDKAEQSQISMSFGTDFQKYVLDKETRAIDAIDINKLAAYAQALNDKIPYLATDKLNTMNVQPAPIMPVPQTTLDEYNEYLKLRDELYPGMAKANSIYYSLPAEDRAYITRNNPQLVAYQKWDKDYKKTHENVKMYSSLISANYDVREMEDFCSRLDPLTMRHLKAVAYSDKLPDKEYKMVIENLMKQMQITDKYDYFIKDLKKYILGE